MRYHRIKILNFIYSSINLFVEKKVLDAGGGTGWLLNCLRGTTLKVVVDLNRNKLKVAKVKNKVMADIENLPFVDDCFDTSFLIEVLEHLKNPQKAVNELARVCRIVVMTTPNNSILRRIFWKIRGKPELSSKDHVREYSPTEIKRIFEKAEFKLAKFNGIGFIISKPRILHDKFLHIIGESIPYLSSKVLMQFERKESK